MVVPVSKLCQQVIDCPVCRGDQLCIGGRTIKLKGLPLNADVALVDVHGREIQRASANDDNALRLQTQAIDIGVRERATDLALRIRMKSPILAEEKLSVEVTGEMP
jgi:hypothetical protein